VFEYLVTDFDVTVERRAGNLMQSGGSRMRESQSSMRCQVIYRHVACWKAQSFLGSGLFSAVLITSGLISEPADTVKLRKYKDQFKTLGRERENNGSTRVDPVLTVENCGAGSQVRNH
jgi:hypothetical protein